MFKKACRYTKRNPWSPSFYIKNYELIPITSIMVIDMLWLSFCSVRTMFNSDAKPLKCVKNRPEDIELLQHPHSTKFLRFNQEYKPNMELYNLFQEMKEAEKCDENPDTCEKKGDGGWIISVDREGRKTAAEERGGYSEKGHEEGAGEFEATEKHEGHEELLRVTRRTQTLPNGDSITITTKMNEHPHGKGKLYLVETKTVTKSGKSASNIEYFLDMNGKRALINKHVWDLGWSKLHISPPRVEMKGGNEKHEMTTETSIINGVTTTVTTNTITDSKGHKKIEKEILTVDKSGKHSVKREVHEE